MQKYDIIALPRSEMLQKKVWNPLFSFKYILLDTIIVILSPKPDWHYKELVLILPYDKHGSNRQVRNLLAQPHVPDQRVHKHRAATT